MSRAGRARRVCLVLSTAALSLLGGSGDSHGLLPAIARAASPPFIARLPAGYQGDAPGKGVVPETTPDMIEANRWPVEVTIQPPLCDVNGLYSWSYAGRTVPNTRTGPCHYTLDFPKRGDYAVTLTAQIGSQHRTATAVIRVRGWLIAAIGDSIASGEGVPDIPGPPHVKWQNRQCHRSARAAPSRAAEMLQAHDPGTPVTFVSLACSGASIKQGMLGAYEGQVPGLGSMLPPQIGGLRLLSRHRHIDALLISGGANDLYFGRVIAACAPARHLTRLFLDCFNRAAPWDKEQKLSEVIQQAAADLRGRYARLAAALRTIPVGHIFLLQYMDPLNGSDGKTCRWILGIRRSVLDKAKKQILDPLDTIGREVATQNRWDYVDGVRELFSHHGYCAGKVRWVVTGLQSAWAESGLKERISGTLHPNAKGHDEIAQLIVPKLEAALFSAPPKPPPSPSAGEVSAPVADGVAVLGLAGFAVLGWQGFRRTAPGRRARKRPPPSSPDD